MTKKEIVNILVNEYGVESKGLMKKTVKELEEMLGKMEKKTKETKEVKEIEESKEAKEVEKVVTVSEIEEKVDEVISEVQLNIFETIVRRFESPKNLRIENLGAGDVFVGETKENLIQEKNRIAPEQGVYLTNISALYITSASRPIIRIIY